MAAPLRGPYCPPSVSRTSRPLQRASDFQQAPPGRRHLPEVVAPGSIGIDDGCAPEYGEATTRAWRHRNRPADPDGRLEEPPATPSARAQPPTPGRPPRICSAPSTSPTTAATARAAAWTGASRAVLAHLAHTGCSRSGRPPWHLDRAQSVVSEIVDGLERQGLLMGDRDPADRRRTLVWLHRRDRSPPPRRRGCCGGRVGGGDHADDRLGPQRAAHRRRLPPGRGAFHQGGTTMTEPTRRRPTRTATHSCESCGHAHRDRPLLHVLTPTPGELQPSTNASPGWWRMSAATPSSRGPTPRRPRWLTSPPCPPGAITPGWPATAEQAARPRPDQVQKTGRRRAGLDRDEAASRGLDSADSNMCAKLAKRSGQFLPGGRDRGAARPAVR